MENTIENATAFLDELSDAFPKMRFSQAMVEYAASVRPEVVVPKKIEIDYDEPVYYRKKAENHNMLIDKIKHLNPTLTFTELNQAAPTGDKSDEG